MEHAKKLVAALPFARRIDLFITLLSWHAHNAPETNLTMILLRTSAEGPLLSSQFQRLVLLGLFTTRLRRSANRHRQAIGQWHNVLLLLHYGMRVWEPVLGVQLEGNGILQTNRATSAQILRNALL